MCPPPFHLPHNISRVSEESPDPSDRDWTLIDLNLTLQTLHGGRSITGNEPMWHRLHCGHEFGSGKRLGILKMLLLHPQAVVVRIGGRVGGIVTWADVLDLRKTKAGSARRHGRGGY